MQLPFFKNSITIIIQGLTEITDSTLLPNHKNISKLLQLKYENYVSMLTNLIEKQNRITSIVQQIYGIPIIKALWE